MARKPANQFLGYAFNFRSLDIEPPNVNILSHSHREINRGWEGNLALWVLKTVIVWFQRQALGIQLLGT